jgi:hypothetical protein
MMVVLENHSPPRHKDTKKFTKGDGKEMMAGNESSSLDPIGHVGEFILSVIARRPESSVNLVKLLFRDMRNQDFAQSHPLLVKDFPDTFLDEPFELIPWYGLLHFP